MYKIVSVIALPSEPELSLEAIESHYRQSPFIAEICVFAVSAFGEPDSVGVNAVVVPDVAVLRERRIVNVRELIRFEIEGLSLSLSPRERVVGFDVTLEPLPRTGDGTLKRAEILERYRTGQLRVEHARTYPSVDDHIRRIVAVVQAVTGPHVIVRPDSNFELDLGLDSLDRVELLAVLEQRLGLRIPDEVAQCAFVVRDVAEALRGATPTARSEAVWPSLLEVTAPGAELRALLKSRTVTALLVFGLVRVLVRALTRPRASGLEHLPRNGAFIISPNHQTYVDPLVLESVLPFRIFRRLFFVGATEYFQTPVTAWLARALNIVPVDPDANLLRAMQAGAFGLRHGKVLMLFPEGERSIDGAVKAFRKGAAILSQHLDVPIVPVAINGMFEIWPRSRPLDWKRLLPWSGHRVTIRFGPPISAATTGSPADHIARVRAAVEAMWTRPVS